MDTDKFKEAAETAFDKETYQNAINKLTNERDRLERELKKEYRSARSYVRSHPEQGVGVAFIGGLVAGFLVAKLFD